MQIIYTPKSKDDLDYWLKTGNKPILRKIVKLTQEIAKDPFEGVGKPEPLKHELTGYWSRRINKEHRYVYAMANETLIIVSLRGHY
ncbi:MAG: Txe/YoeB family addiction module toxin [Saprospiraceae bacterium]|nr:Txe/YoeB family addiction module toxin [Saprospiraceae bacterium]